MPLVLTAISSIKLEVLARKQSLFSGYTNPYEHLCMYPTLRQDFSVSVSKSNHQAPYLPSILLMYNPTCLLYPHNVEECQHPSQEVS